MLESAKERLEMFCNDSLKEVCFEASIGDTLNFI